MSDPSGGEFETFVITRHWISARPDGRQAILFETNQGRVFALEIPRAILPKLAADLAKLLALEEPPDKSDS